MVGCLYLILVRVIPGALGLLILGLRLYLRYFRNVFKLGVADPIQRMIVVGFLRINVGPFVIFSSSTVYHRRWVFFSPLNVGDVLRFDGIVLNHLRVRWYSIFNYGDALVLAARSLNLF